MTFRNACRALSVIATAISLLVLGGCGGGGGASGPVASAECAPDAQKNWLRNYMLDWYLWSGASPNPEPDGYDSVQKYFDALRYAGAGAVPADRWSYISDSASYSQFFEEGKTLGYGLFVNGLEQQLPLKVRFVDALSSSAMQGLARGDVILAVNGRPAADLIAANDFSALSPAKEGDTLVLEISNNNGPRTVTLTASTYALTPVPVSRVLTLANGSKAGYLMLRTFITQAEAPLATAFSAFRAAGATELILDLRYNGGGRISTTQILAALVAGQAHNGALFTSLNYNATQSFRNSSYTLSSTTTGFTRVVVLTGARTCSASELLVNGLKPYMQVVTVGAQTCGKPFGFNPATSCSSTFSAVNFEAFNVRGEGRYYDGIAATCTVADNFSDPLGDPAEALTSAATSYLQTSTCPVVAAAQAKKALAVSRRSLAASPEPGERRGMWAD